MYLYSVSEDLGQAETRQDRSQSTTFQVPVLHFLSSCLSSCFLLLSLALPCPVLSCLVLSLFISEVAFFWHESLFSFFFLLLDSLLSFFLLLPTSRFLTFCFLFDRTSRSPTRTFLNAASRRRLMADLRIYPYQIACEMRCQALTPTPNPHPNLNPYPFSVELTPDITSGFTLPDFP